MSNGFKDVCDNCGKDVVFPFKPIKDRPKYCKDCFLKTSYKQIETIIKSFNDINTADNLKNAVGFLALQISKVNVNESEEIKQFVTDLISKLVVDKRKRLKILSLLNFD